MREGNCKKRERDYRRERERDGRSEEISFYVEMYVSIEKKK